MSFMLWTTLSNFLLNFLIFYLFISMYAFILEWFNKIWFTRRKKIELSYGLLLLLTTAIYHDIQNRYIFLSSSSIVNCSYASFICKITNEKVIFSKVKIFLSTVTYYSFLYFNQPCGLCILAHSIHITRYKLGIYFYLLLTSLIKISYHYLQTWQKILLFSNNNTIDVCMCVYIYIA